MSDLMVFLSVPMIGGLGYWEHNLAVSPTNHKILQIVMVAFAIGWAFSWNSIGEWDRIRRVSMPAKQTRPVYQYHFVQAVPADKPQDQPRERIPELDEAIEIERKYHVSNH
jgi:hypothetical protein